MATLQFQRLDESLEPIVHLDFTAFDSITAHTKLGIAVQSQVHSVLQKKLNTLNQAELVEQVRIARACRSAVISRLESTGLDILVKSSLSEYLECLYGWARGAQLDSLCHEILAGLVFDGVPITDIDLAFLLQAEAVGCQTGIIRDNDGSIIVWHTEEDAEPIVGSRFDKLRLFSFRRGGARAITAFIYPDLLPGPAFGWNDEGFVQAADTLYVKSYSHSDTLPPNVAAWLSLCIGNKKSTKDLIQAIGPYRTGYAITTIQRSGESLKGDKVEFAGNQMMFSSLPDRAGSYLFQVNIFSDRRSSMVPIYEEVPPSKQPGLEWRVTRTQRALRVIAESDNKLGCLRRLLSSRVGGDFAYSNKDVKAYFLCRVCKQGMLGEVGVGPATRPRQVVEVPLDLQR